MKSTKRCRRLAGAAAVLIIAGSGAFSLPHSGAAEIELYRQVRCESAIVTLGDVAAVRAADPQEAKALSAVELFSAPPPGQTRFLRAREIQDLLLLRGVNLAGHRFTGASQVTLSGPDAAAVAGDRFLSPAMNKRAERLLRETVLEYFRQVAGADETREVRLSLDAEQARRIHDAGASISVRGGSPPWTGAQRLEVLLASSTGPGRSADAERFALDVQVDVVPPVVVTARSIQRGAVITAADVRLQREGGGQAAQGGFRALEEVIGSEVTQAIGEGTVVRREFVRAPLMVRRGDVVTVYARSSGIRVRTVARARDEGSLGDLVGVEAMGDRRLFFARVCGIREVEVYARAAQAEAAAGHSARASNAGREER